MGPAAAALFPWVDLTAAVSKLRRAIDVSGE